MKTSCSPLGNAALYSATGYSEFVQTFTTFFNVLSDDKGNDSVKGRSLDLDLSRKCKFAQLS